MRESGSLSNNVTRQNEPRHREEESWVLLRIDKNSVPKIISTHIPFLIKDRVLKGYRRMHFFAGIQRAGARMLFWFV